MDGRRTTYCGLFVSILLLVAGCYGPDLESEDFNCFGDEDCAAGYQCRLVGEQQVCLEDNSDDVRLCETYCDQFLDKCEPTDDSTYENPYDNREDCLNQCDAIPADGEMGDTSGNTIQCRFYHIGIAAPGDSTHCPHAFPLAAGGGCTGECFDFCSRFQSVCGAYNDDSSSPEVDLEACRRDCRELENIPESELADPPESDTFECREFYLDAAQEADEDSTERDDLCADARSEAGQGGRCE
ncbi:MAG: hypothetical protein ACQEVA_15305 [Myxococcota bacterium]